jgi:hypothetical protein
MKRAYFLEQWSLAALKLNIGIFNLARLGVGFDELENDQQERRNDI